MLEERGLVCFHCYLVVTSLNGEMRENQRHLDRSYNQLYDRIEKVENWNLIPSTNEHLLSPLSIGFSHLLLGGDTTEAFEVQCDAPGFLFSLLPQESGLRTATLQIYSPRAKCRR